MLTDNVLALMNSTLTSLEKRAIHSDVRKYSKKYHLFDIIKLFFMPIYSDLGHFVHEVTVKAKAYLENCEKTFDTHIFDSFSCEIQDNYIGRGDVYTLIKTSCFERTHKRRESSSSCEH